MPTLTAVTAEDLSVAIDERQLTVHYQPVVDMATGVAVSVEALVRWPDLERGMVPPAEFIPVAERSGSIMPLTALVIDIVTQDARSWREAGFCLPCAINVSAECFKDAAFTDWLLARLTGCAGAVTVEITESVLAEAATWAALERLAVAGVPSAIDDFGTGYSSLARIKLLPAKTLKIDRSLINDIAGDSRDFDIAVAVVALARSFGMDVIAEGIETEAAALRLLEAGVVHGQGFYFAHPMPPDNLKEWLQGPSLSPIRHRWVRQIPEPSSAVKPECRRDVLLWNRSLSAAGCPDLDATVAGLPSQDRVSVERTLLSTVLDTLPDVIYVKDMLGRKLVSNAAAWRASGGASAQDVLGKSDFDLYEPDLAARFWADDLSVLESGTPVINREEPGRDGQGNPIWVLTTKVPLRDDDGNVTGLVGIGRDISARKQVETALRDAQEQLKATHRELQQAFARERQLSTVDDLTGAHNRRSVMEHAEYELGIALRYGSPLSLLMFDIDHFKQINDTFGHLVGDEVLVQLTRDVAAELRATDTLGRFGGDEFIVLMPNTDGRQGLVVAKRIRSRIARTPVGATCGQMPITLSIGITHTRHQAVHRTAADTDTLENLLHQADQALYSAKEAGRDCIRVGVPN